MGTHSFPASCHFPLSGSGHYSHLLFILFQLKGNNTNILLYFSLSFVVNINNCDSLQIAILPCIFCNPPNITVIMPFKLYSCSKSFSNVTIDHGSQFQPPRVLQGRLSLLRFHSGIDLGGTRLTLTTTLVAREDQKHLKALKWHLCILPRSDLQ